MASSTHNDESKVSTYADLWLNGFDVVREASEDSAKTDKVISRYLMGIAQSDAGFAQKLSMLSASTSYQFAKSNRNGSSLHTSYQTFRGGLLGMVARQYVSTHTLSLSEPTNQSHLNNSYNESNEFLKKMAKATTQSRDQRKIERKKLIKRGQLILQEVSDVNQAQISARSAYERACDECDAMIDQNDTTERIVEAIKECDITFYEFKDACDNRVRAQKKLKQEMSKVLNEFEKLERERYSEIAKQRSDVVGRRESLRGTIEMLLKGTSISDENVNVKKDVEMIFKRQYRPPKSREMEPLPEPCDSMALLPEIVRRELFPGQQQQSAKRERTNSQDERDGIIRVSVPKNASAGQAVRFFFFFSHLVLHTHQHL